MKRFAAVAALLLALVNRADAVEIQKSGAEQFPGKFMVGVNPVGLQLHFTDFGAYTTANTIVVGDRVIYKMNLQFAGLLKSFDKVSLWLGGEFNLGGRASLAMLEPGIFVQLTLEKLVTKIPLVPIIRAGFSGPIYVPYGFPGVPTSGAFEFKVGGGAYYFLTKNIGLGADTNFAFGPGFVKVNNVVGSAFAGYWDFSLGARFAF
jgi:hypothetical protein